MIAQSYITEWSEKLQDEEFLADTDLILGPEVEYDAVVAWTKVLDELVVRLRKELDFFIVCRPSDLSA